MPRRPRWARARRRRQRYAEPRLPEDDAVGRPCRRAAAGAPSRRADVTAMSPRASTRLIIPEAPRGDSSVPPRGRGSFCRWCCLDRIEPLRPGARLNPELPPVTPVSRAGAGEGRRSTVEATTATRRRLRRTHTRVDSREGLSIVLKSARIGIASPFGYHRVPSGPVGQRRALSRPGSRRCGRSARSPL